MFSREERERAVELYFSTPMSTKQVVEHLGYPTRQCLERWLRDDPRYADAVPKPPIPSGDAVSRGGIVPVGHAAEAGGVFRCSYTLSRVSVCWVGWFGVVMVWIQRVARRSSSGRLRVPRSISLMRLEWTPRASLTCCWVMPCVTRSSRSRRPRSAGGSPMGVAPVRMEMRAR